MLKKDLRTRFLVMRENASPSTVSKASFQISENATNLPVWHLSSFHIYLHAKQKKELETGPLITFLRKRNKRIIVPKMYPNHRLQHFLLSEDTVLETNKWGIPEPVNSTAVSPSEIDVVFIPLLAFDRRGHRVGYGKGYYDRFLSECRKDCIKVGLSLFEAVDEITDAGEHDIPLDYCLTPEGIYEF